MIASFADTSPPESAPKPPPGGSSVRSILTSVLLSAPLSLGSPATYACAAPRVARTSSQPTARSRFILPPKNVLASALRLLSASSSSDTTAARSSAPSALIAASIGPGANDARDASYSASRPPTSVQSASPAAVTAPHTAAYEAAPTSPQLGGRSAGLSGARKSASWPAATRRARQKTCRAAPHI